MKKIIYNDGYGYKVTSEDNYNATIKNASKIIDCKNFDNAASIIEYFVKYCNAQKNDFVIID